MFMTQEMLMIVGAALGALLLIGLVLGDDDDDSAEDDGTISLTDGDDNFDQRLDATGSAHLKITAGEGDDIVLTGDGDDEIDLGPNKEPVLDGSVIGADIALAGLGEDVIHGGDGRDLILPEQGNDTAYGGGGDDIIDDQSVDRNNLGRFGDLEALRSSLLEDGFSENLDAFPELSTTFLTPDDDIFYGGAGNDHLNSGTGGDTLFGETGDDWLMAVDQAGEVQPDTLYGGLGDDWLAGDDSDWLEGGTGSDQFLIHSGEATAAPSGPVTIADYQIGVDAVEYLTTEAGTLSVFDGESGAVLRFLPEADDARTVALFPGLSAGALTNEITAGHITLAAPS